MDLIKHPRNTIHDDYKVSSYIACKGNELRIGFRVKGDVDALLMPRENDAPCFRDELWQTSCFELFVKNPSNPAYQEYNFATNGDWAAYDFADYREDMKRITMKPPIVNVVRSHNDMEVSIHMKGDVLLKGILNLGFCVILETQKGKSYWAIAHDREEPDFHQKHCFLYCFRGREI